MARKNKKTSEPIEIVHAPARPQLITETIETNYMPYVMSVSFKSDPRNRRTETRPQKASLYHV